MKISIGADLRGGIRAHHAAIIFGYGMIQEAGMS